MGRIILVTGGASSGKSDFAEKICIDSEKKVLYIATNVPIEGFEDEEMNRKKKRHIERREGRGWDTVEVFENIVDSISDMDFSLAILDCVTMMVTNIMFSKGVNGSMKNHVGEYDVINSDLSGVYEVDYRDKSFYNSTDINDENGYMDFDIDNEKFICMRESRIFDEIEALIDYFRSCDKELVLVTNENSMGVVPMDKMSRYFVELYGRVNQRISQKADEVYFVVSGIPMKIK